MSTQNTEELKKEAVRNWEEHRDFNIRACAKNLGISKSA